MASIAEVIDFLMNLMRDDDTRKQFERDPDATLTDRGMENVTGQDVRDARLMMADEGMVSQRAGGGARPERSHADRDAVREIQHTSTNFQVGDVTTTVITINDNDTVVVDSFNTDVTAIQDNDTTDVDIINIEDDDTVEQGDEDSGAEEGAAPEGGLGADEELVGADEGAAPADGTVPGDVEHVAFGPAAGEAPLPDDGVVSIDEPVDGSEEFDSGTDEGFAPEDSGFGTQPELGAEAGLTPEEPLDELVG
jgi:hypothetical protein